MVIYKSAKKQSSGLNARYTEWLNPTLNSLLLQQEFRLLHVQSEKTGEDSIAVKTVV